MASLTGQLVAETYKALLKVIDNDILTASEKQITDGFGGGSNVFIDSNGFLRANKYKVTNGLATQFLKADGSLDANTYLTSITGAQVITALGYTPVTDQRTLTINGVTYNLSANRTWTIAGTSAVWGNITGTLANQTDLQNALNAKYNNPTGTISQYIRGDGSIATFPTLPGGLPTGGTAGQILSKIDSTDYNAHWIDNYATQTKNEVKLGATLAKGAAVYVSSANGTNMIVSAASNTSEATSSKTFGLLETGGATNDFVKCVTFGLIAGLDTSAASAGDPVWLGVNGALIFGLANKPVAPAHMVYIGVVTRVQSNNGEIFVNVQNGFEIEELHDVLIQSKVNNQGLFYESSTGLWKNKSIATVLGYTPQAQLNGSGLVRMDGTTVSYDNNPYPSGSGSIGYISKWNTTTGLGNSSIYESSGSIGLNTTNVNYSAYGRAFTGGSFATSSFGYEIASGATADGGLLGGLAYILISNDASRRIGAKIESNVVGTTATNLGADLRFYVKPDAGVLLEIVRMTSGGITFNKDLTATNITATSFIKSGGLSNQFLMADGSVTTYTNPVTGTGSAGYIPKWTTAANIGSSLIYDDGTSIGIAYSTPNKGGYGRTLTGAAFGSASFGFEAVGGTTTNGGLVGGLSFILSQNDASRIVGSAIQSNLVGTTATNYGADLRFYAKADAGVIGEVARMTSAGLRVYGTIVKDGGTSSQYLMADGSVTTLTGVVTGSGTTNFIPKWTSASAVGNSIISEVSGIINVSGDVSLKGATSSTSIIVDNSSSSTIGGGSLVVKSFGATRGILGVAGSFKADNDKNVGIFAEGGTDMGAIKYFVNGSATTAHIMHANGNVGIGTATDSGYKLDVNGIGRFGALLSGTSAEFSSTISAHSGELTLQSVATNNSWLANNFYFADGLFKYKRNGYAQAVYFDEADFEIRVADTGIANNSISWKTGLRIYSASGNLESPQDFTANKLIKSGGTSTQFLKADGSIDSSTYLTTSGAAAQYQPIGTYPTGSGSVSRLARWTSGSNLSVAQIWDDGTNIGIGAIPGAYKLDVNGTGRFYGVSVPIRTESTANNEMQIVRATLTNGAGFGFYTNSTHNWLLGTAWGETSSNFILYNAATGTQTMRVDYSNNDVTFSNKVVSNDQFRVLASGNYRINNNANGLLGYLIRSGTWKGTAENNISFATDGPYGVSFFTNGTTSERLHITSGGNIIINNGTTDSGFRFDVNGTGRFTSTLTMGSWEAYTFGINNAWLAENVVFEGGFKRRTTGYAIALYSDAATGFEVRMANTGSAGSTITWTNAMVLNGSSFAATFISSITATSFFESSDFRLKTLIESNPIINEIEKLEAKLYEKNGKIELGYFAQDAELIMPYAVTKNDEGFLNLSYREIHTAKIARLEKEVAELKEKLNVA